MEKAKCLTNWYEMKIYEVKRMAEWAEASRILDNISTYVFGFKKKAYNILAFSL